MLLPTNIGNLTKKSGGTKKIKNNNKWDYIKQYGPLYLQFFSGAIFSSCYENVLYASTKCVVQQHHSEQTRCDTYQILISNRSH